VSSPILLKVIAEAKSKGVPYTALLILANHANKCCGVAWPSLPTLARECRISKRYLIECLHNLELSGELIIRHQRGRHGGNLYFPMPEKVIPSSLLEHEKRCPLDHPKLIKEKERKKETQQTVPAIAIALREKESLAHWITPGTELGCRTFLSCISKGFGGFCSRLLRLRTGKLSSTFRLHGFADIF